MSERDALAALGRSENLLHQITENVELCGRIMGIISLLIDVANDRGMSFEGVQVGPVTMVGTRMAAHVTFSKLAIPRRFENIPEAKGFAEFLGKEAEGLYLFIVKNPDLMKWVGDVVGKLDYFCRDKGKKFEELTFSGQAEAQRLRSAGDFGCFFTPDDYIVLEVDR